MARLINMMIEAEVLFISGTNQKQPIRAFQGASDTSYQVLVLPGLSISEGSDSITIPLKIRGTKALCVDS